MPADPTIQPGTHVLDAQHPWPGLAVFQEQSAEFFHGRHRETAELVRLVERGLVTVLYGKSGLGKSSLLQAGLFRELHRPERRSLPVLVTLKFTGAADGTLSRDHLVLRVKEAIAGALIEHNIDARPPRPEETLYEYFHREEIDFWDERNHPLTMVLVFDQFEEIFTLGATNEARNRTDYFLSEFAALAENQHTEPVLRRFADDPGAKADCDFDKQSYKIVISLREDFLPHLGALRDGFLPGVLNNTMRLDELTPAQALDVVRIPGGTLLAGGVAEQIVRYVGISRRRATEEGRSLQPAITRGVDPAILSLVCQQLNEERIKLGRDRIEKDQIDEAHADQIIERFYRESLDRLEALEHFIETSLVTREGHRCPLPEADVLASTGIRREDIDFLVARRILVREMEAGVPWLRLSHDRLTGVVCASREARHIREEKEAGERREREAGELRKQAETREQETRRRLRLARLAIAVMIALFACAVAAAWKARVAGREAVISASAALEEQNHARTERDRANENRARAYGAQAALSFSAWQSGRVGLARELLADSARGDSEAGQDLRSWEWYFVNGLCETSELSSRKLTGHTGDICALQFIPDPENRSQEILVSASSDKTVRFWDIANASVTKPRSHGDLGFYFFKIPENAGYLLGPFIPGSPIARDGRAKPFSIITKISDENGQMVPSSSLAVEDFAKIVRGPPGGKVRMVVEDPRQKKTLEIELARELVDAEFALEDEATTLSVAQAGDLIAAGSGYNILTWSAAGWGNGYSTFQDYLLQIAVEPDIVAPMIAECFENQKFARLEGITNDVQARITAAQESPVLAVALSKDGSLATGAKNGKLVIWDTNAGNRLWEYQSVKSGCQMMSFSPDGRFFAALVSGHVQLFPWRKPQGSPTPVQAAPVRFKFAEETSYSLCIAFSESGDQIAAGGSDGVVRIWSTLDGKLLRSYVGHESPVLTVAFSHNGELLASAGMDQTIRLWKLRQKTAEKSHDWYVKSDSVTGVAFSADGRFLAACDPFYKDSKAPASGDETPVGLVTIFDACTGSEIRTITGCTYRFDFSPKAPLLPVPLANGDISIVNADDGETLHTLKGHHGKVRGVAYGPDGTTLVSGGEDGTVWLWNADQGTGNKLAKYEHKINSVAFSPTGRQAAAAIPGENKVILYDLTGRENPREFSARTSGYNLCFSRDGKLLVSGEKGGRIRAWNTVDGREEASFTGHTSLPWDITFSRDGRRMFSLGDDRTLRLWDVKTRRELISMESSEAGGNGMALSADGWRLATAEKDTVHLWDAAMLATEATTPDARFLAARGMYRFVLTQWESAIRDFTEAIRQGDNDIGILPFRARARAETGDFDGAANDYRTTIARDEKNIVSTYKLGLLDLMRKDRQGFFEQTKKIVAIAQANPTVHTANNAIWSCSLLPDTPIDLKPVLELARQFKKEGRNDNDFCNSFGALLYRTGDFAGAISKLHEATALMPVETGKTSNLDGNALDWIFLAMASYRAGDTAAAVKWLKQTEERYYRIKSDPFYNDPSYSWNWANRQEFDLLLNEARELIWNTPGRQPGS